RPGMTFVDLGANIGYYSVLASRLVGPEGRVFAFEPDTANLELLLRNVRENGCRNVAVAPYAVSDRVGFAELYQAESAPAVHSIARPPESSRGGRRVMTVSLDEYFPEGVCPDFVKMDVEGAEFMALSGMTRLLSDRRLKVVVFESLAIFLEPQGRTSEDLDGILRRHGFGISQLDKSNRLAVRP
ncbi:MAG: FkbM family methyltransferase, partial [Elusimicrobia bacterium]|nr:FkbM family methyltransferase [Elusimicrobiota bacterium]